MKVDFLKKDWTFFAVLVILTLIFFNQAYDLYERQKDKVVWNEFSEEYEQALAWLKENTNSGEIIFSEWTQGHQIVSLAKRRVVATSKVYPTEAEETAGRYNDIARFFFSDSEEEALAIAKKYQAKYVFVKKNFDWWTCRYIGKCNSTTGVLVDRMIRGDKFNELTLNYESKNFLIFRIDNDSSDKRIFAGYPEGYFNKASDNNKRLPSINIQSAPIYGAILPHHLDYNAAIISNFLKNLSDIQTVDTFILLGPDHFNIGTADITASNLVWKTPWGEINPNLEIIKKLENAGIKIDNAVNEREHSLKAFAPFIEHNFPKARIVPILFKNDAEGEAISNLKKLLENSINRRTIILLSADFAHRLTLEKTKEADEKSASVITNFNIEEVKNIEVDAKPAVTLLMSIMADLGYKNVDVLMHSNNLELLRDGFTDSEAKTVSYLVSYSYITFSK